MNQNKPITQEQLGQHFLNYEDLLNEIVSVAELDKKDILLEIGAGTGNLTKKLCAIKMGKIIASEIDPKLVKQLEKEKLSNITLLNENGLETAFRAEYNKIVANIPYHISEPLFRIIIKKMPSLCVFTTGDNFFEILQKNESSVASAINCLYNITKIADVPRNWFSPQPRTDSVAFKLKLKENHNNYEKIIIEILQQDDKVLKNALEYSLKRVLKMTGKEAGVKAKELIPENLWYKRVIQLSNAQYSIINNLIKKEFEK